MNDYKAFIKHSNDMDDTYGNIKKCNPNKKRKILNALDDMIADMISNKNLNLVVTEKISTTLAFVTQSYLAVPKNIWPNSTHFFNVKIPNKQELQQTSFNHSLDIDFKDFVNLYRKCTAKRYSF